LWRQKGGKLVAPINTVVDAHIKDALEQQAFWERRSMTAVLESAILAYVEKSKAPLVRRELGS
jgi:hypothetical protein